MQLLVKRKFGERTNELIWSCEREADAEIMQCKIQKIIFFEKKI